MPESSADIEVAGPGSQPFPIMVWFVVRDGGARVPVNPNFVTHATPAGRATILHFVNGATVAVEGGMEWVWGELTGYYLSVPTPVGEAEEENPDA